ncbi:argininosuccinate synthase [Mycolicibacterium sp. YH-1]|uniref:argininosuccinate synthase n=1 Tax=Mycolicibacterium sp. YH-1 TaxID=2908837 RepID=UPI001F4BE3EB|nr:argininosuccinate synthase [Mycolicibacterium sp. YH-1]UNB54585.1 argininosuccinate synthase [Mycolicibacterium sp. YH-1]
MTNGQSAKDRTDRVALAYSGGVDTTACIPYLRHEMRCSYIVAVLVDLGQPEDLDGLRQKALDAGADQALIVDCKDSLVSDFALRAIAANAVYDRHYPLCSALGRPLIASELVKIAHDHGCGAVAHGSTGKGNDQVRFDLAIRLLDPRLTVIAPARLWDFSRADTIKYSLKHGIAPHVTTESPWAIDMNILGRNVEAGSIEDLEWEPTEEVWHLVTNPESCPDVAEYVSVAFDRGRPTMVNGVPHSGFELIRTLNDIGGRNGVGRVDMIENRVVGIKSRELYEVPGLHLLLLAHREIENLALPADVLAQKAALEPAYARLIYDGMWFSLLRSALDGFIDRTDCYVTGEVTIKLFKGSSSVVRRTAPKSLYRPNLVTYGSGSQFDQSSAEGFIDIFGLSNRVWSEVHSSPLSAMA